MGATLERKKYSGTPDWDHDNCDFCSAKFSDSIPGCLTEGWTTTDNYHWICDQCFADFKDYFKWKIGPDRQSQAVNGVAPKE